MAKNILWWENGRSWAEWVKGEIAAKRIKLIKTGTMARLQGYNAMYPNNMCHMCQQEDETQKHIME